MANQHLIDYILRKRAENATDASIREELLSNASTPADVDAAFAGAGQPAAAAASDLSGGVFGGTNPEADKESGSRSRIRAPKRLGLIILAGGLIATLGGGYAAAKHFYFDSPSRVFGQMVKKFPEVKTAGYRAELRADVQTDILAGLQGSESGKVDAKQNVTFAGSLDGVSDVTDTKDTKHAGTLKLSAEQPNQKVTLGVDYRVRDNTSYFQITDFPAFGFIDTDTFRNKWVKVTSDDVKDAEGGDQPLSPDKIKQIRETTLRAKAVKVSKRLNSQKIDGQSMYHYRYVIDKDGLKKLLFDVDVIVSGEQSAKDDQAGIEESLKKLDLQPGEIWIGKKDYLPHKLTVVGKSNDAGSPGTYQLTVGLKQINQPIKVEVPAKTQSLEEVVGGLLGSTDKDSDKDGLSDTAEATYGTDAHKADTDGDGHKDGEEVDNGFNPKGPGKLDSGVPAGTGEIDPSTL